ncbi:MAG: hypothetical protein ABIF19_10150 [Planctomycetota bacterium]
MKKTIIAGLIVMMVAGTAWSLESADGTKLNGPHETLNIIGVKNPKTADMDSDTGKGSVIFVNLSGKSKIGLVESGSADAPQVPADEFAVLDKNGTDADGALFALPNPGLDPYVIGDPGDADTLSDYTIYVRPLGKPLGVATITTCANVVESGLADFLSATDVHILNDYCEWDDAYASVEQVGAPITFRNKGKTTFTNVTAELLTIVLRVQILDGTGDVLSEVYVRIPIFDPMLENEYWQYDNDGLKLLQVRIYPWGTDVTYAD